MKKMIGAISSALEYGGLWGRTVVAVLCAIALALSFTSVRIFGFDPVWIAIILCGAPIVWEACLAFVTQRDVKAGLLVTLAIFASIYLHEYFAAGEVAFIMALGETLEELATSRARAEIVDLSEQIPTTARLVEPSGIERVVAVQELRKGDVIRIMPGEKIPVDGHILRGETSIDEKTLTGESTPAEKGPSSATYSGSVNLYGAFDMTVDKVESDSSLQQIVRMMRSTEVEDSRLVRLADRWATVLVFCSVIVAVATYLVTRDLRRAATVLVVFCPCSLVLATPTALLAALSAASRHGVYLKSADVMELLAKITCVAFDKTGTLTEGRLVVSEVKSLVDDVAPDALWDMTAALEARSEHPIGRAIAESRNGIDELIARVEDFRATPGYGVSGRIDGRFLCVGSEAFLSDCGTPRFDVEKLAASETTSSGKGVVFVSLDGRLVGYVATSDRIRESAKETIDRLRSLDRRVLLLSGDSELVVREVAAQLGVSEARGRMLPIDKSETIDELRRAGEIVCMVGDGFNDAIALKRADVGASLASVGADIALEASDMTIYRDDIAVLPDILTLAQRARKTIKVNLTLATLLNALGVFCAVVGVLSPTTGALFHNAGSLATILNSLRLLPVDCATKVCKKRNPT